MPVVSLSGREDIEDYLEERSRTSEGESEDRMMSGTAGSQNIGAVIADAGRKPLLLGTSLLPEGAVTWEMEYDEQKNQQKH